MDGMLVEMEDFFKKNFITFEHPTPAGRCTQPQIGIP
jgi:hypothetical protein